jgi:putative multicomponent Na+:H+ antiporter subunit B
MNSALNLSGQLDLLLPITALLPLTAVLLVSQGNPYQTLVLRGILGSVATLLYALLGAPDVALTEALVGTLLSTTLYAVALRSSMAMRLEDRRSHPGGSGDGSVQAAEAEQLGRWIGHLHLRLHWISAAEQSAAGGHGWLEDGGRLVLLHGPLLNRLQQSPGYSQWQQAGGELAIAPACEP